MRAGDQSAFERFFERHSPRVLVYINYNMGPRLRRKLDPSDVLQNIYLGLLKDFESFYERVKRRGIQRTLIRMADHDITEAYRYYFKVDKRDARRELTAALSKVQAGDALIPIDWVPSDATSVSAKVVRNDEYRRVMKLLGELTPIEQYVTVARLIEGVPAQEIAERVGKSRGAIQMILARARDKLRELAGSGERGKEDLLDEE
jgi:RNA polymerase sigma-70 factor (ECF subfamily)